MLVGAISAVVLTGAPAANADSGYCGVRAGEYVTYDGAPVYMVYNKCSRNFPFSVRVPIAGLTLDLGCQTVPAGGFGYYVQGWPLYAVSPYWYIVNC